MMHVGSDVVSLTAYSRTHDLYSSIYFLNSTCQGRDHLHQSQEKIFNLTRFSLGFSTSNLIVSKEMPRKDHASALPGKNDEWAPGMSKN